MVGRCVAVGLIAFFIAPLMASGSSRTFEGNNNNIPEWKTAEEEETESRHRRPMASAALLNGILACQSDPCFHGLCIDHTNSSTYSCFCEDGFTGYQCQTNWNECWNGPCRHGGTCVDGVGRYHCLCRPGFTGDDCQVNIDECQSDPCQNGATCQDGENGYRCRCLPGYEGVFCQVDISVCRHNDSSHTDASAHMPPTCRNGARCVEGPGLEFHCLCPEGWTGKHCETDVDECCSNPCKNGGRCIDLIGSYQCACHHGFTGKNCETALERCDDRLCGHQGICWLEGDGQTVCYCRPDYHGIHCEFQYNECLLPGTKCLNGGRCIDQVDGYSCSCPPLWTGPRCQTFNNNWTTQSRGKSDRPKITTTRSVTKTRTTPLVTTMSTQSITIATAQTQDPSSSVTTIQTPVNATGDVALPTSLATETTTINEGITIPTLPDESISTTTISAETTTTTANETTTSVIQDLLNFTTTADENLTTSMSSVTTESIGLTTVKSIVTATSPSDLISTTTIIPIPEPKPENKSGNGREREINTVPSPHGLAPTTTAKPTSIPSSSTKLDGILTTATAIMAAATVATYSTVDVSVMTRTTDPSPSEDNLVTITLGREMTSSTTEIDSYDMPVTELPDRDIATVSVDSPPTTAGPDHRSSTTKSSVQSSPATEQASMTTTATTKWAIPWEPTLAPSACTSDVCMNGGTCVITPDGWQCRCSWRNEGRRCELDRKLRVPQFHGNSYLSYVVPDRMLDQDQQSVHQVLEARLEFSTTNPLGLIAYIQGVDAKVYLAVYTERSTLKFRLSCGQKQMTLVETKYNVSDGAIHVIFVRFLKAEDRNSSSSFCMGSVKLNNSYTMNGEQRLADDENFSWPARLHIGGRPSGAPTPTEIVFLPGMVGCAYSLEIDGQKLDMTKDAVQGKALDECPDRRANCGGLRCLNGGVCNSEDEQRCLCPMGWVGDQCEIRQCPCNPCLGNSTCLMSANDQMICVCTYGRVGTLCEVAVNVTRPQFDGTLMGHSSYLSLAPPPFIRDHFELKFSFVTDDARQVALLLFIGQQIEAEEKDFLAISFIRGHVALTWDLGSGTRRIFTARPVSISTMGGHSVHVGRRGRVAWLQVNNQPTVTGRSPGLMSVLNAHPNVFLGGHSSFNHSQLPSDLPLHSGFRGCIYDLVFRSRDQDFNTHWLPPIQTGRGVRQCSIPSCRLRMRNDTWTSSNGVEDDLNLTSDQTEDDVC